MSGGKLIWEVSLGVVFVCTSGAAFARLRTGDTAANLRAVPTATTLMFVPVRSPSLVVGWAFTSLLCAALWCSERSSCRSASALLLKVLSRIHLPTPASDKNRFSSCTDFSLWMECLRHSSQHVERRAVSQVDVIICSLKTFVVGSLNAHVGFLFELLVRFSCPLVFPLPHDHCDVSTRVPSRGRPTLGPFTWPTRRSLGDFFDESSCDQIVAFAMLDKQQGHPGEHTAHWSSTPDGKVQSRGSASGGRSPR